MGRQKRRARGKGAKASQSADGSASPASKRVRRDAALGGDDQTGRRNNVTDGEVKDRNPALKAILGTEGRELIAHELELHVDENRKAHHTDDFEQEDLIVRRGQEFSISVTFGREYNRKADDVIIQLTTGTRPQESKGTLLRLKVARDQPKDHQDWFAVFKSFDKKTVKFSIVPATDAIVGKYGVFVETVTKDNKGQTCSHRREFPDQTFVVLFNAWCEDDSVYMEDDKEREEYVLADRGRMWFGEWFLNSSFPWNFGQFEDCVLEAALYILDQAELSYGARICPIKITRCISSMTNSFDNNGVLEGRWTDEYPKDSTHPGAWTGSVAILEEFMKTKKSVRFGQCWVFSGVVTTLLRCLGIPTRSVTNFESAHDNDGSMTIDFHFNEDGEPQSDLDDSVWNFHVWNESYFKRSDLPKGYGGWQALDATPQEASEGVMRCGPAPVKAIKEGNVYLPHDAPFIFAEVNGDRVHWLVKKDGSMEVINKDPYSIGYQISTKAVGSNALHDLTLDYKYKDGSPKERSAVQQAYRYSSRREYGVVDLPDPDVTFTLKTPDCAIVEEPITVSVNLRNTTKEKRNVSLRLTAVSSYYTGVPNKRICTKVFTEDLTANQAKTINLEITPEQYQEYLKPGSTVSIYMKGSVIQTKRSYAQIKSFEVVKPQLNLQVLGLLDIGVAFSVTIQFTNPLNQKLTGGVFHLEAAGITKPLTIPYKKAIRPHQEVTYTVSGLTPKRSGDREIAANFSCDQMFGLTGSAEVYVSYLG